MHHASLRVEDGHDGVLRKQGDITFEELWILTWRWPHAHLPTLDYARDDACVVHAAKHIASPVFAVRLGHVRAVDLAPVTPSEQTQRPFDLFLIFVGVNIVASTLQAGASLPPSLTIRAALWVVALGTCAGAVLVGALAPVGSRLGVPSIVAARAALGINGARLLAWLLVITNFAWIALNNVVAASITTRLTSAGTTALWAVGLGLAATIVVRQGPRAVALADRVAVPLLVVSGIVLTAACLRAPIAAGVRTTAADGGLGLADVFSAFDIVAGYQVSWLLMFADYPRYVASPRQAGLAVFFGLALTGLWFMPLGLLAATAAGSSDPGAMVYAVGIGWWGAGLLTLATVTTNFVNIYMSALAFRALFPSTSDRSTVWLIGGIGAALSLLSTTWIERFASFTYLLAAALVPIGGILLAHYVLLREPVHVPDLYASGGPYHVNRGWSVAGTIAWLAGASVFVVSTSIGATLPSLVTAVVVYTAIARPASVARTDRRQS
jgi:purine-cytosine permease-like protein